MKKILYITNISDGVSSFSKANVEAAHKSNLEFHLAGNFSGTTQHKLENDKKKYSIDIHQIDLARSPFSYHNIKALKQLIKLIKHEKIDYIHCNTPVGGLLGRIAGSICKVKKVIYQAHGFHFYKGAPLINWLIYYSVEKFLALFTDILITINNEDYEVAKKFKLRKNGKVYKINGVGIELELYKDIDVNKSKKREELGLKEENFICIGVGRVEQNKNYKCSIEAIAKLNNNNIHLLICGEGPEKDKLKKMAIQLKIEKQIHFLGYRNDIRELLSISDCYLSTSKREGLPRSLMEAMACGLPCIVSKIRGNNDLIKDDIGGYLVSNDNVEYIAKKVNLLFYDKSLRQKMSKNNLEEIKKYDINKVIEQIERIYEAVL